MPVFKLIMSGKSGPEVTRWDVQDELEKVTWERLTERVQAMLKTQSTEFSLYWSDGVDCCIIRDNMDLHNAAAYMMGQGDKSIRIYVSREEREPPIASSQKPPVTEQKTDREETPLRGKEKKEKPQAETVTHDEKFPEKDHDQKHAMEFEPSMTRIMSKQPMTTEMKTSDESGSNDSNSSDGNSDDIAKQREESEIKVKLITDRQPQTNFDMEHTAPAGTASPIPNNPTLICPRPMLVSPTEEMQAISTDQPTQPPPYSASFFPQPDNSMNYYGFISLKECRPYPAHNVGATVVQSHQAEPKASKSACGSSKATNTRTNRNSEEDERLPLEVKLIATNPSNKGGKSTRNGYKNLSLQTLQALGFKQDETHLKEIIKKTKGDIHKVIHLLNSYKNS